MTAEAAPVAAADAGPDYGRIIAALIACSMLPGSRDKYFARRLGNYDPANVNRRHKAQLLVLAWKYRRQLPPSLVPAKKPDDLPPAANSREGRAARLPDLLPPDVRCPAPAKGGTKP